MKFYLRLECADLDTSAEGYKIRYKYFRLKTDEPQIEKSQDGVHFNITNELFTRSVVHNGARVLFSLHKFRGRIIDGANNMNVIIYSQDWGNSHILCCSDDCTEVYQFKCVGGETTKRPHIDGSLSFEYDVISSGRDLSDFRVCNESFKKMLRDEKIDVA